MFNFTHFGECTQELYNLVPPSTFLLESMARSILSRECRECHLTVCVLLETYAFILTPLCLRQHYYYIINKSYKILGFIFGTTKPFSNQTFWVKLYNSRVRSTLEYCSSVGFPLTLYLHTDHIMFVQRRFVRMICSRLRLRRELLDFENRLSKFVPQKAYPDRQILCEICKKIA